MPSHFASRGKLTIIGCESGKRFAERVAHHLDVAMREGGDGGFGGLCDSSEVYFANGEMKTVINESVRGDDVYVIQCVDDPCSPRSVNDNFMAFCTAINAAKQADADCITAVLPQFPFARQERKKTREGVTAKQIARFLEISGADRVITLDIHAEAIGGFFETAVLDDLHASRPLIDAFRLRMPEIDPHSVVVVSPDVGSADRARFYSRELGCNMAICDKERDYTRPGTIKAMRLVGDVRGKDVLVVDDMIATGGSMLESVATVKRHGARDVYIAVSLPFFNGDALEKFEAAYREGMFKVLLATDSVMRAPEWVNNSAWYEEISVAPLFAQVLYSVNRKRSVSRLLE